MTRPRNAGARSTVAGAPPATSSSGGNPTASNGGTTVTTNVWVTVLVALRAVTVIVAVPSATGDTVNSAPDTATVAAAGFEDAAL